MIKMNLLYTVVQIVYHLQLLADDIVNCSEIREQMEVCAGKKRSESQSKQEKTHVCE